jgi:hypothetical protein
MGSVCITCNSKTGFINPETKCQICQKNICSKCAVWGVKMPTSAWKRIHNEKLKWYQEDALIENYLCSVDCAFKLYQMFVSGFSKENNIAVYHVSNLDIQVWIESAREELYLHLPEDLCNGYMKQYGKLLHTPGAVTIPESQPLLIKVKEDALNKGFSFELITI